MPSCIRQDADANGQRFRLQMLTHFELLEINETKMSSKETITDHFVCIS